MTADLPSDAPRSVASTARGGARISLLTQIAVQLGSASATVILAKLLSLADFGIIAVAQSLLGLATLIGFGSIAAALVTTRAGDVRSKASSYFWTAVLVGGLVAAVIASLAAPITRLLGQPHAGSYVQALTVTLPLSLMTLVPQALLQRRRQFTRMNLVTLGSAAVYFVSEVVLALVGLGAWAVILGQILGAVAGLVIALALSGFVPALRLRVTEVREDADLIGNMSAASFLTYVGKNADYWVVSPILGGAALGVYYIAYVLPSIIRVRVSGIFRQVMLPVLARMADPADQAATWQQAMRRTMLLLLPGMTLLAALAEPLILLLFGEQWRGAVAPMQLITAAGIADVVFAAVATLAIARRTLVTRSTVLIGLRAVLIAILSAIGAVIWRDLAAVAAAVLVAAVVTLVVQEFVLSRPLQVGTAGLGLGTARVALVCAVTFVVVHLALGGPLADWASGWRLLAGMSIGIATLAAAGAIIARAELRLGIHEAAQLLRRQGAHG